MIAQCRNAGPEPMSPQRLLAASLGPLRTTPYRPNRRCWPPVIRQRYSNLRKTRLATRRPLWSEHIEEIITGFHPRLSTPSPGYDPALTTQNERVEAKVLELRRAGESAPRATLLRKKKAFLEGGPAALIDGRKPVGIAIRYADPGTLNIDQIRPLSSKLSW